MNFLLNVRFPCCQVDDRENLSGVTQQPLSLNVSEFSSFDQKVSVFAKIIRLATYLVARSNFVFSD